MPTYVYKFVDSGETIEIQQSFSDPALTEAPHPSDGKMRPVKKVFQPVGITFKGGGFYKTDSGGGSTKTSGAASESSAPSSSSSSDSGSSSTASTATPSTPAASTPSAS